MRCLPVSTVCRFASFFVLALAILGCSRNTAEEEPAVPPEPPPAAMWAAFGESEDEVGFALRLEPGAAGEPWLFNIGDDSLACLPQPTATGWHFEDCGDLPYWLESIVAEVPSAEGEPLSLRLELADYTLSTQLRRVPDRAEPTGSATVELVWHHEVNGSCGSNLGIWADGGYVYAPCASGAIQIHDGATGEVVATAHTAIAPAGRSGPVLEVVARDGVLYAATPGRGVISFDVSDPARPVFLGQFYINDGQGSARSVTNIHTLTLSPDGTLLFAINQSHPRSDIRILDVTDPANLRQAGIYLPPESRRNYGFSHDITLEERDGRLIGFFYQLAGGFHILDATDPRDVQLLSSLTWPSIFSHSGWPFEAGGRRYLAHADEGFDQGLTVIDVTSLAAPRVVSTFKTREGISIHNLRVVDGIAFIAYYVDGLRIVDLRDPLSPREIGHYDTLPAAQETDIFAGAWGVDLDNGLIYLSDRNSGVYAFRFEP